MHPCLILQSVSQTLCNNPILNTDVDVDVDAMMSFAKTRNNKTFTLLIHTTSAKHAYITIAKQTIIHPVSQFFCPRNVESKNIVKYRSYLQTPAAIRPQVVVRSA